MKNMKYAILTLHDLKIRKFERKDEWKNAIIDCKHQMIVFKWHEGAGQYQQVEVCD